VEGRDHEAVGHQGAGLPGLETWLSACLGDCRWALKKMEAAEILKSSLTHPLCFIIIFFTFTLFVCDFDNEL
jgi:hypothetical protein